LKAPKDEADDCVGGILFTLFEEVGLAEFIHTGVDMDGATTVLTCGLAENTSPNKSISNEFPAGITLTPDPFCWCVCVTFGGGVMIFCWGGDFAGGIGGKEMKSSKSSNEDGIGFEFSWKMDGPVKD